MIRLQKTLKILFCVCSFIPALSLLAQSRGGTIDGFVVDSHRIPIPDLHVILLDSNRGDVTDPEGYFVIQNIPPGQYSVKFDHISFTSQTVDGIELHEGESVRLDTVTLDYRILELDGVVVTATRTDRRIVDVAQQINIVSDFRIDERHATTPAEALREEPGITVQKTTHGGGSAMIRGLSSNQILILVDGIRLNNALYRRGNHPYLTTIDVSSIHQMEIVRGPTSVLYGSDALGGTINAITHTPFPYSPDWNLDYRLLTRYASADGEKTAHGDLSIQKRGLGIQAGFSYKDYDDLRRGGNSRYPGLEKSTNGLKQSPSGFRAYDLDTKVLFNPKPGHSFILAGQISRRFDVPRYDKYENNAYSRWLYTPQDRKLAYLVYEHNPAGSFITSIRLSLSHHVQEEGREIQKTPAHVLTKEMDRVGTTGLSIQLHSLFGNHLFTYGSEHYFDRVNSERRITNPGQPETIDNRGLYPDGSRYTSLGLYVQDEIRLSKRWTATPGARWSLFASRFTLIPDSSSGISLTTFDPHFQAITGNFGLVFRIREGIFLNFNAGQAFRAPNLSDMTKLGESKGIVYEIPNVDLIPEKMISLDTGVKINLKNISGTVSVYYARIRDLISSADDVLGGSGSVDIRGQTYKVKSKQNIGTAFLKGLEMAMQIRFDDHWSVYSNLTSIFGQNSTRNEPMSKLPSAFGLIGIRRQAPAVDLETTVRFASKQDRLSSDDLDDPRIPAGGTPGWWTWNIRTGFRFGNVFTLRVALENLLDVNYREHASGINAPGRNLILSLEVDR